MSLATERLDLIPLDPRDVLALIESEAAFTARFGFAPAPGLRGFYVSGELSPAWLEQLQSGTGPNPWQFGFAVVLRADRLTIGTAGFKGPPDGAGMVEIAYGTAPDYQRQGFATESAGALMKFAKADARVKLLRAHTLPEANASTRVLTRCGFAHVGEVVDPDDGPVWRWERPV